MIKKRTRPQLRVREHSDDVEEHAECEDEEKLTVEELIELRRLRKSRQGIDTKKLVEGKAKRRTNEEEGGGEQGGLKKGASTKTDDDDDGTEAKTRKVVRTNNFTQQTNALDVDKHMMAYIEENLKIRSRPRDDDDKEKKPADPQEELYRLADRWKVDRSKPTTDEGSVTNSMSMLTAIPEVDLGMDTRLKNIEDTEKAKRVVAEGRQERKKPNHDEAHLVASTRFYRPNLKAKSDADIMRDAKLEAMGLPPRDDRPHHAVHDKVQMATDELVMERFKKRMRRQ